MSDKHFRRSLTELLLMTLLLVACSSTPRIEGQVYLSAEKNIPFPGVTISLMDASLSIEDPDALVDEVTTDENGNYGFTRIQPGAYTLVAKATLGKPPANITDCPSGLYFIRYEVGKDWWINSSVTPDGHMEATAISALEFSVSTGDAVRYNLDFACN